MNNEKNTVMVLSIYYIFRCPLQKLLLSVSKRSLQRDIYSK